MMSCVFGNFALLEGAKSRCLFPAPKELRARTVLEYAYCTTSNATRRSGMENEYMKVAYDIIHNTLVLIIASSMHIQ